jgi:hypothetical protein
VESEREFRLTHPAVLSTMHTLSIIHRKLGDFERSKVTLTEAKTERCEAPGGDYADPLLALLDLSITLQRLRLPEEAETISSLIFSGGRNTWQ